MKPQQHNHNLDDDTTKNGILSHNTTFKTAFMSVLGFYAAQLFVTLLGLSLLVGLVVLGLKLL